MASTYSPSLRLELMATGDQSGTWGVTTNTNLGTLLEQAITGVLSVAQGDVANLTLTSLNGTSDQARNAVVDLTGAMTANRNVVVPTANKLYLIKNSTSGGFSVTVKTVAGTGVAVAAGTSQWVYCDGTNVVQGLSASGTFTAPISAPNFIPGYTTTATAAGTTTLTATSNYYQRFTGATTQTVTLPVTSTLVLGQTFEVLNDSTGAVTVQSSGANAILILAAGTRATFECILTSGTTAASWVFDYHAAIISTSKKLTATSTITLSGTDGTTMTFPAVSASMAALGIENQALTGGATVTPKNLGTQSSGTLTLDLGDCPEQYYTNNGAHTLAPGAVNAMALIDITNGASAGAITTSGWTKVAGDSFTTTNTNKFRCHCSVSQGGSLLVVQALQ